MIKIRKYLLGIVATAMFALLILPFAGSMMTNNPTAQKIVNAIGVHVVLAATDSDLTALKASTTALFTDNKGLIINWGIAIFSVLIIIGIAFSAMYFVKRKSRRLFH